MGFSLSEEQAVFKSSVERFMLENYDLEKRRGYLAMTESYSVDNWKALAELGVLALPFSENVDGLGGQAADLMVTCEAFGMGPLVEPFLSTILLCGHLIEMTGSAVQQNAYLPKIMSGELRMALAYCEREARFNIANHMTTASQYENGYQLSGQKTFVLGSSFSTDVVLVLARTEGEQISRAGLTLFSVPMSTKGVETQDYKLVDGTPAMNLNFKNVALPHDAIVGELHAAYDAIEFTLARASLAMCSEAIGVMEALFSLTLEYLKTRKQFGRSIGSFQALQHRMAEHFVTLEQAKSIVMRAVATPPDDKALWLSEIYGAKAFVSDVAMSIGQDSIQLHGGMGTTDELIISHYHKRLLFIQNLFGDADHHYRQHLALAS